MQKVASRHQGRVKHLLWVLGAINGLVGRHVLKDLVRRCSCCLSEKFIYLIRKAS